MFFIKTLFLPKQVLTKYSLRHHTHHVRRSYHTKRYFQSCVTLKGSATLVGLTCGGGVLAALGHHTGVHKASEGGMRMLRWQVVIADKPRLRLAAELAKYHIN